MHGKKIIFKNLKAVPRQFFKNLFFIHFNENILSFFLDKIFVRLFYNNFFYILLAKISQKLNVTFSRAIFSHTDYRKSLFIFLIFLYYSRETISNITSSNALPLLPSSTLFFCFIRTKEHIPKQLITREL